MPAGQRRIVFASFALVVIAAAALRLYDLGNHPPGLFCDEAASGYNSFAIAEAGIAEDHQPWPLFFWSFAAYKYPTYIYPGALAVKVLGLNELSTRLPAALYGTATVATIFFAGWALSGPWVGLAAAVFLAFMPWHIQFSRIAFSLVSFGFFASLTILFLLLYTRGRKTLPLAAATSALCLYSYAVSAVFIPLLIAGFALLYVPELARRWMQTLLAAAIGIAVAYPFVDFYQNTPRAWRYGQNISWVKLDVPSEGSLKERARAVIAQARKQLPRFKQHYWRHLSDGFLFVRGDPIKRHSVRGHGELLPLWISLDRPIELPYFGVITTKDNRISGAKVLIVLGALICLLRPSRRGKLILLWLVLFPVGAAMIRELPSASRSFVGTGAFALLAATGLVEPLRLLGWLTRQSRVGTIMQVALVAAFAALSFVPAVRNYLHLYFVEYPKYVAAGSGGFQYGYGPAIRYMESRRDDYELMMISTSDTNQPPIFARFYRQLDPHKGRSRYDLGYFVADPAHFGAYEIKDKILYALRRRDLHYFDDYEIKKEIIAPGGQETFLVTEIRSRKRFLDAWLTLGPFDNKDNSGIEKSFIDVNRLSMEPIVNVDGESVTWRQIRAPFIRTNLNGAYGRTEKIAHRNPEWMCAYALTTIVSDRALDANLEINGTDRVRIWLNGEELTSEPLGLRDEPKRLALAIRAGDNPLLILSCEDIGRWHFETRITDDEGKDVASVEVAARLPGNAGATANHSPSASQTQ